jgi:ABC-type phosphate transport system substrate-binding protein
MSAFKQGLQKWIGRFGVIAAVVTVGAAAVLAVGGVTAAKAYATCSASIEGQGSPDQRIAQQNVWAPGYKTAGCPSGGAEAEYASTSTVAGLTAWGFIGAGPLNKAWAYIGSDAAPSVEQMKSARAAGKTSGGTGTEPHLVVVPVAQTAIAIVVNPPSECKLTKINNQNLEAAFSGVAQTWTAIGAAPAAKCGGALTRVVRAESSGVTYQFKNYLSLVNKSKNGGTEKEVCAGEPKWSELEEISAAGPPNTSWPTCSGAAAPKNAVGGVGVAEKVAETTGRIGYVELPDAKSKGAKVVEVQNNGTGTTGVLSAGPVAKNGLEEEVKEANCAGAEYEVPPGALAPEKEEIGKGLDVDWSKVSGGAPSVGGTTYPICTLTYDIGWHKYTDAGFGAGVANQVKGYFAYILANGTGTGTERNYYANLPTKTGGGEVHNVQQSAEFAIKKIE